MSDSSDESDDCDDEEEDSAGDDAAHDGERRDDRYGLPVRRSPDQDKRHQLQNKARKLQVCFFYRPQTLHLSGALYQGDHPPPPGYGEE